jgi:starch synthase
MGLVSRLVDQKGIDLLVQALPSLIDRDIQWVFLGEGDPRWEGELRRLGERYPEKVAVTIGFDTALSHRITAGADFILMPSRYEPCGYNQLYGMRYGTIPLARAVGGLKDTVKDVGRDPEGGTGILFQNSTPEDFHGAILRSLETYQNLSRWRALQERAMLQDFSWKVSAKKYLEIYGSLSTRAPSPLPGS